MAKASLATDLILLEVTYREEHLAKSTPGMRYHMRDSHSDKPHFALPLSWASCVTLRGVFGQALEIDPALAAWAREERDRRVRPSLELRDLLELPEDHPMAGRLDGLEM